MSVSRETYSEVPHSLCRCGQQFPTVLLESKLVVAVLASTTLEVSYGLETLWVSTSGHRRIDGLGFFVPNLWAMQNCADYFAGMPGQGLFVSNSFT